MFGKREGQVQGPAREAASRKFVHVTPSGRASARRPLVACHGGRPCCVARPRPCRSPKTTWTRCVKSHGHRKRSGQPAAARRGRRLSGLRAPHGCVAPRRPRRPAAFSPALHRIARRTIPSDSHDACASNATHCPTSPACAIAQRRAGRTREGPTPIDHYPDLVGPPHRVWTATDVPRWRSLGSHLRVRKAIWTPKVGTGYGRITSRATTFSSLCRRRICMRRGLEAPPVWRARRPWSCPARRTGTCRRMRMRL